MGLISRKEIKNFLGMRLINRKSETQSANISSSVLYSHFSLLSMFFMCMTNLKLAPPPTIIEALDKNMDN